ncbi:hypothetical protein AB0425_17430 [Actinosynnema sp. NPDC051121]
MSYERAVRNCNIAGLIALVCQMIAVVLKASGATDVSWSIIMLPALGGVVYLGVSLGTYYLLTARDRMRRSQWRRFDYEHKQATAPPVDQLVWIVEDHYSDIPDIGYFDGFTMRLAHGSDDCSVSWWAPITYPEPPAQWKRDRARRDAEVDAEGSR